MITTGTAPLDGPTPTGAPTAPTDWPDALPTDAGAPARRVRWAAVLTFLAVAYGGGWVIALPLWRSGGLSNPLFLPLRLAVMTTPTLAALVATFAVVRPTHPARFLGLTPARPWRRTLGYALLGFVGVQVLGVLAILLAWALGVTPLQVSGGAWSSLVSMQLLGLLVTVAALGEEIGWRGFLLPALRPLGTGRALVLSGLAWGPWHAPLVLLGYNYGPRWWAGHSRRGRRPVRPGGCTSSSPAPASAPPSTTPRETPCDPARAGRRPGGDQGRLPGDLRERERPGGRRRGLHRTRCGRRRRPDPARRGLHGRADAGRGRAGGDTADPGRRTRRPGRAGRHHLRPRRVRLRRPRGPGRLRRTRRPSGPAADRRGARAVRDHPPLRRRQRTHGPRPRAPHAAEQAPGQDDDGADLRWPARRQRDPLPGARRLPSR